MSRPRMWIWAGATWGTILVLSIIVVAVSSHKWNLKHPYSASCYIKNNVCVTVPPGIGDYADERGDQCEKVSRDSMVLEFENTWSNFAYLLAGLLILYRCRDLLGINLGANLCTLFLFSSFYHAALQPNLQTMDVAWVYCAMLALIFYGIGCVVEAYGGMKTWLKVTLLIATYALGMIMAIARTKFSLFESTNAFIQMAVVLFSLAAAGVYRIESASSQSADGGTPSSVVRTKDFTIAMSVLLLVIAAAAFLFRLNDGSGGVFCSPASVVQAHALWHVLSAAAILFTYELFAMISGRNEAVLSDT